MKITIALACLAIVTGCTTSPLTPKDRYLNRYVGAEITAMNCPAFGGYGSAKEMRSDANQNLAHARKLGATEKDIQDARMRVNGNFQGAVFLVGPIQACSTMINSLAWAGTSKPEPATSAPKVKKK